MNIELKNITFKYDERKIFDNFSLKINQGETICLVGANGSGKSTLAKIISGLLALESGEIIYDGQVITEENVKIIRDKVGIIFQNPDNQFVGVTVKDDIAFGMENRLFAREVMEEKIHHYLKLVDMEEYINRNPEELSGGQKQRIAVAGILALDPEIIIFDEATSMLDPTASKDILNLIKNLQQDTKKTIIMITHNIEETLLADRVIILDKGHIYKDSTPEDVFKNFTNFEEHGLKTLPSVNLLNNLKNVNYKNKKEIEDTLWELIFKM